MALHSATQDPGTIELLAKLFCGFADFSRLNILECLNDGELTVSQLVEKTGLSQSNVSNHLSCLRECGLVKSEQRARFVFYRIGGPRVRKLLLLAKDLLEEVRSGIENCENYGPGPRKDKSRSIRKVTT